MVSLVGFTVTSMLCGIAGSLGEMVLFRLLQGVFGAALVPLSQSTMLDIYPPEQRGSAMAIWGMGVMMGPILGPTLGGYLTELYNWRWVFFVNLPFGVLATVGLRAVPARDRAAARACGSTGIGFGVVRDRHCRPATDAGPRGDEGLVRARPRSSSRRSMAGLGLYLFIVHMFTSTQPFINPRIFKDRNLAVGLVVMFAVGLVLLAVSALLAPWLQDLATTRSKRRAWRWRRAASAPWRRC